MTHLMNKGFK